MSVLSYRAQVGWVLERVNLGRPAAQSCLESDQVSIRVLHQELGHAGLGDANPVPLRLNAFFDRALEGSDVSRRGTAGA